MSSVARAEARHRRLRQRSAALVRRDHLESARRTRVRSAVAVEMTQAAEPAFETALAHDEDREATRFVGTLIVAGLLGMVVLFHQPLLAAIAG